MIFNFNQSPFGNRLYTTKNNKHCKSYDANYFWYNFNGYDKNICFNPGGLFSMVFMHDYRFLLSLLYEQEITAQRPHWIFEIDHVHRHDKNQKVARLMGLVKRPREINEEYTPFNIFDNWVVLDETKAFEFMKDDKFTLEGPIILSESPHFSCNSDVVLKAAAKLIKKTADSLTFHIKTNKNCVILVPEIYHRDWQAIVDGNKTNVLKAFASMRGIALPSGEHSVIMRFVYRPFYLGLFIASGSLLLSIILIYFCKDKLKNLLT